MISFVVIGRNEGWKLTNCLDSIYKTIRLMQLADFEVIYIDSNSEDDSIIRAKKFDKIRIFRLTTDYSPAIGRNLGARLAKGDILCFIDGDMEIVPDFFKLIFNKNGCLIHSFISGQYINYFYNENYELQKVESYYNPEKLSDAYQPVVGGLFIIERKTWDFVSGMREIYKMGEDLDFGLRLAKKGIYLLRKKEVMGYHHTIEYNNYNRMWRLLFNKAELFGRSMLYRNHIFNINIYQRLIRNDYGLITLVLVFLLSILFSNPLVLTIYPLIVLARSFKASGFNFKRAITFPVYFIIRDIIVIIGVFTFFPPKTFKITFDEI